MKNYLHLSLWLVLLLVLVPGCSLLEVTKPGELERTTDENPTLSAGEVLQRAEKSITATKGARYDIVGDQSLSIEHRGNSKASTMDFNASLQLAHNPFAVRLNGNMNTDVATAPMEIICHKASGTAVSVKAIGSNPLFLPSERDGGRSRSLRNRYSSFSR